MITVQSDLKIEVNAKEITLRNEGDLLLLQFPDWTTYKLFRNTFPANSALDISNLANELLLTINGRKALALKSDGKIDIESVSIF